MKAIKYYTLIYVWNFHQIFYEIMKSIQFLY